MSQNKPLTLYGQPESLAPNPIKVAIVLEELGLEYNVMPIDIRKDEQRSAEYLEVNPNGRTPALVDHSNGNFTIWKYHINHMGRRESDAILLYLVERYDPEHKLSVAEGDDKFTLIQWLFFQASGQGPYFGQGFWFKYLDPDPEKLTSAIGRYQQEVLRVFGVLDGVLSKQEWLVGGKPTIADLSFVTLTTLPSWTAQRWNTAALNFVLKDLQDLDVEKQFPSFYRWHQRLCARPAVSRLLAVQAESVKVIWGDG
ncbi:glutathione S-transferase C-terminal-like protein [Cubamyces lactineus]|nr:glutathione S-transferase C-terminal-like protein [Cubamyces lactineus]